MLLGRGTAIISRVRRKRPGKLWTAGGRRTHSERVRWMMLNHPRALPRRRGHAIINGRASILVDGSALLWRNSGTEIAALRAIGTIDGVQIASVAGINGPGVGTIAATGSGNYIGWRAPKSASFGPFVEVSAGGSFYLIDGDDSDKWVRVTVTAAYLPSGPASATVTLFDVFNNSVDGTDISSAQATAGNTATWQLSLYNQTSAAIANAIVWLDFTTDRLELSWDNVSFFAPKTEADAVSLMGYQSVAAGASRTVYVRRTIPAGAVADPDVLVYIHAGWDGTGRRRYANARGLYRVANAATYRLYRKLNSLPVPGSDAVFESFTSFPYTTTGTFADGTWYLGVTYFDGYVESAVFAYTQFVVSGGASTQLSPSTPLETRIEAIAAGVVNVSGSYTQDPDGDNAANEWAIWYTTDGSTPNTASAPNYTQPMLFALGYDSIAYNIPAQVDGTTVKAVLGARFANQIASTTTVSSLSSVLSTTAKTVGPAAPVAVVGLRGRLG